VKGLNEEMVTLPLLVTVKLFVELSIKKLVTLFVFNNSCVPDIVVNGDVGVLNVPV
jgi:hypothetical protein